MRSNRRSGRPGRVGLWATAVLLAAALGCGGGDDGRAELMALIDAGDWEEVRARVEVLREAGGTGAWLDYAEGMALLHQNADRAAEPLFERAAQRDSSLTHDIAVAWKDLALIDHEEGWANRARERMARAVVFEPTLDPGELLDPVADHFYRYTKEFDRAYPLYLRLYRERPGPPDKQKEWVYRYGYCLEQQDFIENARAVYEEYIETWPQDMNTMRFVQWRYMTVLLEEAEAARAQAQPERALQLLEVCLDREWHMDLQQRARYLAGQIEEDRGNLQAARDWYDKILGDGNRFGGDVVNEARERLDALGELGVH